MKFLYLINFVTSLALLAPVQLLFAQESSQFSVGYAIGSMRFTGDLSSDNSEMSHLVQFKTLRLDSNSLSWFYYLSIDTIILKTHHSNSQFPFRQNSDVNILGFLFIPTGCYKEVYPWQFCFGIGQGTVNVNQSGNRRDYGTWNYHAIVNYTFQNHWQASLILKYIGKVEQQVNEQDSEFSFFGPLLGVSRDF